MKGKIRKNQVVIATLAVLIAIAGYISYDKKGIDLKPNSQEANAKEDKNNGDKTVWDELVWNEENTEIVSNEENTLNPGESVLTGNIINVSEKTGVILYCVFRKVNKVCNGAEGCTGLVKADMSVGAETKKLNILLHSIKKRVVSVALSLSALSNTAGKICICKVNVYSVEKILTHKVSVALIVLGSEGNVFIKVNGLYVFVGCAVFKMILYHIVVCTDRA